MRIYSLIFAILCIVSCKVVKDKSLFIEGLVDSVEVVRDEWGINHIYAQNQHDLFFTQGYTTAKDRLFQFEIWRRQATGSVAEILGERELKRDIGTRLFRFRGDITDEMNHYHKDGAEIITAYTDGVNAYIEEILAQPELLPIEFKMLDILPEKWTPEVVISRHQGLLGNINEELNIGRAVAKIGEEKVKDLMWFHPKDPNIALDKSINTKVLSNDILGLYHAYRTTLSFKSEDIIPEYRGAGDVGLLEDIDKKEEDHHALGSNNWVVNGSKTVDGHTYLANDPHRRISVPSLRYMTHLVAPGWDVIGGGEPEIPGISIGHNEYGTWGLTIFETDGEDLYIYDLNPENVHQYKYKGQWKDMEVISEIIKVKGSDDRKVDLYYTQHGPVTYIDSTQLKAYAIRCAWLEVGGAPYLASLRMDQAQTWEEFREACRYSHIPGENMIWADKKGNIGWQAVGIVPVRKNFSGLVPIPGDGRYEWSGYLPILEKPNTLNPQKGFFATANQNVIPEEYSRWDAVGYTWSDAFRGDRLNEVLSMEKRLNIDDMKALQVDYLSLPARILTPFLEDIPLTGSAKDAREQLKNWDYRLLSNSIPAAIYVAWENEIQKQAKAKFVPEDGIDILGEIQIKRILDWIVTPDVRFGNIPQKGRDQFLSITFQNAIKYLTDKLGNDMSMWQYGQEKLKHTYLEHPLGNLVTSELKNKLNLGPLPRGGNSYTPGSTGGNMQQSSGASFRMIVNTGDWDATVGTNGPGQSGNPDSPFYKNLFEPWAKDQYFPVYYSRQKIDSFAFSKNVFVPKR